jgi:hypothetical protein
LFTFLRHPGLDATNWRGEHAMRYAVVNRKVWGGNRTYRGPTTMRAADAKAAGNPADRVAAEKRVHLNSPSP